MKSLAALLKEFAIDINSLFQDAYVIEMNTLPTTFGKTVAEIAPGFSNLPIHLKSREKDSLPQSVRIEIATLQDEIKKLQNKQMTLRLQRSELNTESNEYKQITATLSAITNNLSENAKKLKELQTKYQEASDEIALINSRLQSINNHLFEKPENIIFDNSLFSEIKKKKNDAEGQVRFGEEGYIYSIQ